MYLDLTLESLYKIIKNIYPLNNVIEKKWHEYGYQMCKEMIKDKGYTLEANIFAMLYYITNFKQEHLKLKFKFNHIFSNNLEYPEFFSMYNHNTKKLIVVFSKNKLIPVNSEITLIDNKHFITYIEHFLLFNNGSINEISDYIEQSINIFINFNNPFLPAPKNITINNKLIKLNYDKIPNNINLKNINIYNKNEYDIHKKNNQIFIKINSFDNINYTQLKQLLPADKIIVDLQNNLGGLISNVESFFKIVYNLDIKYGRVVKKSIFTNFIDDNCKCEIIKLKNKITYPKLEILVNEYSKSACKIFVLTAKYFIKSVKIIGDIRLYPLCGEHMVIDKRYYNLEIPTYCYTCKNII